MEKNVHCKIEKSKKICIYILALGGTLSSIAKDRADEFYKHPSCNIEELLSTLPINEEELTITSEQFLQKISHEMTHADLINIAKKIDSLAKDNNVDGIVVTQGTNCIEETAYFINLIIKTAKPIIFTGSYRPNNALGFDGNRNLYNAILLARSNKTSSMGVLLTFNDYVVSARSASKLNPSMLGDFSSNGFGVLGFIQGNKISIQQVPHYKHTYLSEFDVQDAIKQSPIYVIYGHLCMDSFLVDAVISKKNTKGIISAGVGKGYQPKIVTEALMRASKKGIVVVRCSRTGQGNVNEEPNFDELHGFIAGGTLSPQKARILLSVTLNKTTDKVAIQKFFNEY